MWWIRTCLKVPFARVTLDCTEEKVLTPSPKVLNSQIYSKYKNHTTCKGLIGITPYGTVSFISSLYTGWISDKEITARSGILDLLEENDDVMADKGFLIQDLLKAKNAGLVIPPFIGAKRKLSKNEVSMTHNIARLEIHVERANRRVKGIPHLWRCYSTESCTIHPPNMDSVCYSDKFLRTVTLRKLLGIVSNFMYFNFIQFSRVFMYLHFEI